MIILQLIYSGDSLFNQATPDNAGAATLSHDFMGQNLSLQFFNTMNTAGGNKQSKFGYAALFTGDLMGGMIKPILGYTVKPEGTSQEISSTFGSSTARTNIGEDKYMAAGVQFNMSGLTLEADYLNLTEEDAVTISSAKKDLETTSMVVLGRYTMGNWVPFVKYVSDKAERGGSDYLKRTATSLGFEYNHDEHAKCYFNYTMEDKKPTGGVNYKPTAILAGVKFNVDVF